MLTVAAASLLVGVAAILLPDSVVVLALGGLVARGLYSLILDHTDLKETPDD